MTVGPDNNLWFTEGAGKKIGRITTAGVVTEYGPLATNPQFITKGPDGNLWFTESTYSTAFIGKITTAGAITEYPTTSSTDVPLGIVTGPDGNLWVAEFGARAIAKIVP